MHSESPRVLHPVSQKINCPTLPLKQFYLVQVFNIPVKSGTHHSLRSHHSLQYQHFSCRTDYRSNTFPRTVKDWNELALDAVLSPTLGTFWSKVSSPSQ